MDSGAAPRLVGATEHLKRRDTIGAPGHRLSPFSSLCREALAQRKGCYGMALDIVATKIAPSPIVREGGERVQSGG